MQKHIKEGKMIKIYGKVMIKSSSGIYGQKANKNGI